MYFFCCLFNFGLGYNFVTLSRFPCYSVWWKGCCLKERAKLNIHWHFQISCLDFSNVYYLKWTWLDSTTKVELYNEFILIAKVSALKTIIKLCDFSAPTAPKKEGEAGVCLALMIVLDGCYHGCTLKLISWNKFGTYVKTHIGNIAWKASFRFTWIERRNPLVT